MGAVSRVRDARLEHEDWVLRAQGHAPRSPEAGWQKKGPGTRNTSVVSTGQVAWRLTWGTSM